MDWDVLLSTLNGLILAGWFLASLKLRRIYSVVPGALLIFHVAAAGQLGAAAEEFGAKTVLYGQALLLIANVILAATCTLFDRHLVPKGRLQDVGRWLREPSGSKRRYFAVVAVLVALVVGLQIRGGIARLAVGWEDARETQGAFDSVAIFLSFIAFPSAWVAFRSRKYLAALVLATLCFAIFQVIGSRAVLLTLVTIVYSELLLSRLSLGRKLATMLLLVVVGLGLHTASRLTRGIGLVGLYELASSLSVSDLVQSDTIDLTGGEGNIYRYYYYVIQKSYEHYPYGAWTTAQRLALLYVPAKLAPNIKPADITYTLYTDAFDDGVFDDNPYLEKIGMLLEEGQTGSIHPTLWGEAYANGGLIAVLVVPALLGIVLVTIEKYLRALTPVGAVLIIPLTMVGFLMVARGNTVIGIGYPAYAVPMIAVAAWFGRLRLLNKRIFLLKGSKLQTSGVSVAETADSRAP
jgi:hypothetical protein